MINTYVKHITGSNPHNVWIFVCECIHIWNLTLTQSQHSMHFMHPTLKALGVKHPTYLYLAVCFIALWGLWLKPAKYDVAVRGLDLTEAGGGWEVRGGRGAAQAAPAPHTPPLRPLSRLTLFFCFRIAHLSACTDWYKSAIKILGFSFSSKFKHFVFSFKELLLCWVRCLICFKARK